MSNFVPDRRYMQKNNTKYAKRMQKECKNDRFWVLEVLLIYFLKSIQKTVHASFYTFDTQRKTILLF